MVEFSPSVGVRVVHGARLLHNVAIGVVGVRLRGGACAIRKLCDGAEAVLVVEVVYAAALHGDGSSMPGPWV